MTPPASLAHTFLKAAQTAPQRPFVHFESQTHSYRDLHTHVCRVAGALHAWGLRKGERVALFLGNSPSFVAAYLGTLWVGGVVVLVNTRYGETELRHLLSDSGARLVITDARSRETLLKVRRDIPVEELTLGENLAESVEAWSAFAEGEPLSSPADLTTDDIAVIAYTSGTTGRAKGAVLTHGNFVSNSLAVTEAWGWTAADHLLLALPLFHMHGLGVGLHGTIIKGSALTLKRRFEAEDVLDEMRRGHVTMFFGVPTMVGRLLEEARRQRVANASFAGLRLLVSGSAPLSPELMIGIEETFGLRILERYGMTETVMNLGNPLRGERKPGSVGVPFAGVEVRIVDEDERPTLQGQTGELQLRGPNVMKGYWNNLEATEKSFVDGWFKTGDLGFVDEDGYHFLNGRANELIISGGFNVYPREVEEVLAQHDAVREVAVLGLPDADLGEKVVAVVVASGDVDPSELQTFCKARLASFKKPKKVYFVEDLPHNALGKVQKHLLKKGLLLETNDS